MSSQGSSEGSAREKLRLLAILLPKVSLVIRVAALHILRLSEQSKYLDLRTELLTRIIRSFLDPEESKPLSISTAQKLTLRDPGIKGGIWVSKYTAPVPAAEQGVREAVLAAVRGLTPPGAPQPDLEAAPDLLPVEAEWTGYRAGATKDSLLPDISEEAKYERLMEGTTSPITVLYLHGGAYIFMDPATHRPTTKKLAKLTGGRCYVIRYRLAPQNPFPAALMDALASYLALLYPPPGAFHKPVQPSQIVIAGDSAGGNLALSLLQTILELRRQDTNVMWFGEERELPLPAGVAVNSPWMDIVSSSPSWERNLTYDYLPDQRKTERVGNPPCRAWPADPPRRHMYAADDLVLHPLLNHLAAPAAVWEGSPPVYMCTGWELLADEIKVVARRMACGAGPAVVLEDYEAMPHCFALVFTGLGSSRRCLDVWTRFIRLAVEDPAAIEPRLVTIRAKTLEEVPLDLGALSPLTDEDVRERLCRRGDYAKQPRKTPPEAVAKL